MDENQKTTNETSKSFSERISEKMEEEVKNLKKNFYQKAEAIAISEEQKEAIQELLEDAIKQAYLFGKASTTDLSEISKEAIDKFEDFYKQMTEPTAATRADKYKTLYHNQRIITAHVQAEVQILQAQLRTMESDGNLFTSIVERIPSILGNLPTEKEDSVFAPAIH